MRPPATLVKAMCNDSLHVVGLHEALSLDCMDLVTRFLFPAGLGVSKGDTSCLMALDMLCREMHEAW